MSIFISCQIRKLTAPPDKDGGSLYDPWGKQFQFEIVQDPNGTGDEIPVVFTTNPAGKKIAWPREYGDI